MISKNETLRRIEQSIKDWPYLAQCPEYTLEMLESAKALIERQAPRLITFEDFDNNPDVDSKGRLPAWVEHNWKSGPSLTDDGYAAVTKQERENWDRSFIRWWTSRPSKEQMEAIPWE